MKRSFLLVFALLFLFAAEILKVYFIMPFPGSQQSNTINIAYFLHNYIWLLRIVGIVLAIGPLLYYLRKGKAWQKILLVVVLLLYGFVFYMFNFKFLADKMFYQPKEKLFTNNVPDSLKQKLVIGVVINGEAKAYPIQVIGYHHQVKDTIGGSPVIVTYCTVCRTGRVFSPFVNDKYEEFRLVGMDHFNAMFEDATTKSWWRQANGEAITGKLKGTRLPEIASRQMRLDGWMQLYPASTVLLPDSNFNKKYAGLKNYDIDTAIGSLETRDSASWKMKSWVIGVNIKNEAKAYDWNTLDKKKLLQDSVAGTQLLLTLHPNAQTFYVLNRTVAGKVLHFTYDDTSVAYKPTPVMRDAETNSVWKLNGVCADGAMRGSVLAPVQAYQEFWHSWQTFHPNTKKSE